MISVQKDLCIHPDTVASAMKTASDSQGEIISPPHLFGECDISKAAASVQEVETKVIM
jgi:hypothetical protein